jgi:hypothetical protein
LLCSDLHLGLGLLGKRLTQFRKVVSDEIGDLLDVVTGAGLTIVGHKHRPD